MKSKIENLFFVQWRAGDDDNFLQFETYSLTKVVSTLEDRFKDKCLDIQVLNTGIIVLYFDYINFYVSTKMEKLIDCETLK